MQMVIKTQIMWYTQYCQDCEHLSTSKSAFKSHKYSNHPTWTKRGDITFCEVCGTYVKEYRNRLMNESIGQLLDRHKKTKFY